MLFHPECLLSFSKQDIWRWGCNFKYFHCWNTSVDICKDVMKNIQLCPRLQKKFLNPDLDLDVISCKIFGNNLMQMQIKPISLWW